jgi:uncharacterized surface protein with fasciclin (FAS1) repeats
MIRRNFLTAVASLAALGLSLAVVPAAQARQPVPANNLVEVAIAVNSSGPYAGAFDTLIAAVLAADPAVIKRLTSKGQSTVFAPTDDAFASLGLTPENVGSLDKEFLTNVLLYHVVTGRRDSSQVLASTRLRTLQGGILRQASGVLTDNLGRPANIIVTDVKASNGIIHAIDAVVLPYAP